MSIEWMTHVWNNSKQKGSLLLMLLAIADYANENGKAWPGIETLAQRTRQTHRNAVRIIDKLEKSGEVSIENRASNYGTNVYTLHVRTDKKKSRNPKMSHDNSGKKEQIPSDIPGTQLSPDPLLTISKDNPSNPLSVSTTAEIKAAYLSCVNYPINWAAGAGQSAKWLSENGYSAADVIDCYKVIAADPWWRGKEIGLKSIEKKIGAWKSNVKPSEKELVFS